MKEKFKKYLREILDLDPDKLTDEALAGFLRAYEAWERSESQGRSAGDEAGKRARERAQSILATARAAAATANDRVRAELMVFASELAEQVEVSAADAQRQIADKARELAKAGAVEEGAGAVPQLPAGVRQFRELRVDQNQNLSRADAAAIFSQREQPHLYRQAARALVAAEKRGEEFPLRELLRGMEKSEAMLLIRDTGRSDGFAERQVPSLTANVVIQSLLTVLLAEQVEAMDTIADSLVSSYPSTSAEETAPALSAADGVRELKVGEEYPIMNATGKSVKNRYHKYGTAIAITRENEMFDRLGTMRLLLGELGAQLAETREELVLYRICSNSGFDGLYPAHPDYDSGSTDLYSTSADADGNINYLNTNALVDVTDLAAARLRLATGMYKANGKKLRARMRQLLVPMALADLAWQLTQAVYEPVEGKLIPNIYGPNGKPEYRVELLVSPILDEMIANQSLSTFWLAGDFRRQFYLKEIWAPAVTPVVTDGSMAMRDIVSAWKGSMANDVFALRRTHVVKSDASGA